MKWWRVEVSDHDGQIVAIEPEMLAGREIGDAETEAIVHAVQNLLGFIGAPSFPDVHLSSGGRDPSERIYTKRDVEALVSVVVALDKAKRTASQPNEVQS
jgi:hypothetical protein